jgi:hypothetical protein
MGIVGGVAAWLFLAKVIVHLYLLSKIEDDFSLFDYTAATSRKRAIAGLLPCMVEVPQEYRKLKAIINILYSISVLGIIVFLIWYNAFRN